MMVHDSTSGRNEQFLQIIGQLHKIRYFAGNPSDFWPVYLNILINLVDAIVGAVIIRSLSQENGWRQLAFAPESQKQGFLAKVVIQNIEKVAPLCLKEGFALVSDENGNLAAVRLNLGNTAEECLFILLFKETTGTAAVEKLKWLQLASDVPYSYQLGRIATAKVEHLANVLDFMALLNTTEKFLACAMVFCNEIASRLKCSRVSIGWHNKGYIHLEVMSHVDHFDRKMEIVQQIEAVMEECFDQNTEIILPESVNTRTISRAHRDYADAQNVLNVCSFPLRLRDEPVAVCLCERSDIAFSEAELGLARLLCDQAIAKLANLKQNDCWFGRRLAVLIRQKAAGLLGFEHTWAKIIAIVLSLILAFICFIPVPFRVNAPFILRTETMSYLTAPFEGHIDNVSVRVGDKVKKGDVLLTFDRKELFLEEATLSAEVSRYQREFEKNRSVGQLAQMRIDQAMREQAAARLELVRYRLDRSIIHAPFNGFIVEGDMNERVGAPVKEGDILFKAGRNEHMYAELEVRESDIHYIQESLKGEIALVSRPQDSYDIRVSLIEPAAVPKDKGNVFIVHGQFIPLEKTTKWPSSLTGFAGEIPKWWQPGMTGVGKINAGRRTLFWILTRRTIDFLRLRLWW